MNTRKSILISLLLIASFSPLAHAQDTLISTMLPSNYYVPVWFDSAGREPIRCFYEYDGSLHPYYQCKRIDITEPMTIYGVATVYFQYPYRTLNYLEDPCEYAEDTVPEHTTEYVALLKRVSEDTMEFISDIAPVRMDNSQIRYYYKHPYEFRNGDENPNLAYLDVEDYHTIREAYFDEGITITDDYFYVGASVFSMIPKTKLDEENGETTRYYEQMPFYLLQMVPTETYTLDSVFEVAPNGYCYMDGISGIFLYFPILTPRPDTPDDSLAVEEASLLQSYVALTPNPACERVKVTSSFGMEKVEIFNTQGSLILAQPASGLQSELDVQSLPAGIYFVKVHTPMGIATKRLIVSR